MRLFLFSLILGLTSFVHARDILPAYKFKIDFTQSDLNPADLTVSYNVYCSYRSGIIWPEPKACGDVDGKAYFDSNGNLVTEALSQDHFSKSNLDYFHATIRVKAKVGGADIVWLGARGKRELELFKNYTKTVKIYKLPGTTLTVKINGQDIIQSDWSKRDGAVLSFSVRRKTREFGTTFSIGSMYHWVGLDADNRGFTREENQLENRTSFDFPSAYLATDMELSEDELSLYVRYVSKIGPGAEEFLIYQKYPMTTDGLKNITEVELKKK